MQSVTGIELSERGTQLFGEQLTTQRVRLDRMFSKLMLVQWLAAIVVAVMYSSVGWADKQHPTGGYLSLAVFGGAALSLVPMLAVRYRPGSRMSRQTIAICQILWSALFIHLSGGRIETHFHIFGSLAWLAFYLDWEVLVTATVMVAVDHLLRGLIVPESVYGMMHAGHWRFVEHALWVVFEDVILFIACRSGLRSLREGADRQAHLERLSESEQNKTIALEMALAEMKAGIAAA
jgi:two-component system sensor histidine kinase HydH